MEEHMNKFLREEQEPQFLFPFWEFKPEDELGIEDILPHTEEEIYRWKMAAKGIIVTDPSRVMNIKPAIEPTPVKKYDLEKKLPKITLPVPVIGNPIVEFKNKVKDIINDIIYINDVEFEQV